MSQTQTVTWQELIYSRAEKETATPEIFAELFCILTDV